MSNLNDLVARIDAAITGVKDKAKKAQQDMLQDFKSRQTLLKSFEATQAMLIELARPRLKALADRAGERVKVTTRARESNRSGKFEFRSAKARIVLEFAIAPDMSLTQAVASCDLQVVPVMWKFDTHSDFKTLVEKPDTEGFVKWLDDRILAFVELFIQIHEYEIYDKAEYVEDPVAKVKFPKFAAGATLEYGGQMHYFIDDSTKSEFAKQNGVAG